MILMDLRKALDTINHKNFTQNFFTRLPNHAIIRFELYLLNILNRQFQYWGFSLNSDKFKLWSNSEIHFRVTVNATLCQRYDTGCDHFYADDSCLFYRHKDFKEIVKHWQCVSEDKTKSILLCYKNRLRKKTLLLNALLLCIYAWKLIRWARRFLLYWK